MVRFGLVALVLALTVQTSDPSTLALVGGRIYTAPDAAPIDDGVVIVEKGRIVQAGPSASTPVPDGTGRVLDCKGLVVVAGFQNSHVHFTDPRWLDAATQPREKLAAQLDEMLTRYGFTTVVDTASDLGNTLALRTRIESGELPGPRILTAGAALYPPNGVPFYVRDAVPAEVLALLPTPATVDEAASLVRRQTTTGGDIVKLFVGSWVERGKVLPMPQDIANAATTEAHRQGKLVFVHPSNGAGLEVALRAGVDVLAHAVEDLRDATPDQFVRLRTQNIALVPTLKLFGGRYAWEILDEVRNHARNGGQILFGTDVGYLPDFDPTVEYDFMSAAGLSWREILASLTTSPAQRFGEGNARGRVAPSLAADLVVLGSDPVRSPRAFADIRWTIRDGRVIHTADQEVEQVLPELVTADEEGYKSVLRQAAADCPAGDQRAEGGERCARGAERRHRASRRRARGPHQGPPTLSGDISGAGVDRCAARRRIGNPAAASVSATEPRPRRRA